MATSYKTPGVFLEEIPKLPPSVAQVETAIPAFIGYTQIAKEVRAGDLNKKPKRVKSLVEFELYFGQGASPVVTAANIDSGNNFVSAEVKNNYFMYDSVRMFYANGGGDCFVVSVAEYPITVPSTPVDKAALIDGIKALEKEDDPTILLFPDAVLLGDTDIADVQQEALAQCNKLQDRVAVFDCKKDDPLGAHFRNNIGVNYLKYGMAYTPWLKVNLPKNVTYADVSSVIFRDGISTPLNVLTTDTDIQAIIAKIGPAYVDMKYVDTKTNVLNASYGSLLTRFDVMFAALVANNSNDRLKDMFEFTYTIAHQLDEYVNGTAPNTVTMPDFKTAIGNAITGDFDNQMAAIVSLNKEVAAEVGGTYVPTDITTLVTGANWPNTIAAVASNVLNEIDPAQLRMHAANLLKPMFLNLNALYQSKVMTPSLSYPKTFEDTLLASFPVYKNIVTGVSNSMTSIPPSGAVVGVYATTDRTRGVWKAPANVSLANVIGPETTFDASELDGLNVDPTAGKSINAIRAFTGKGTLIFGARTLAGNDNEWRYISVRRFFNMVEESCKKATEPFVFEPNDANTWVRVQGMIENYLSILWRQGALQGAKPEHAFYVAIGLGKTMTSLDILEGRMIVEIGMAVVRPAEFIILRFSHKMAES